MTKTQVELARWGTRIGLILAAAGNAIGIGNYLRFPSKAAIGGGGAFMIPYLIALVFLAIPMMWIEWTIGRYAGKFGHTTTAGAFDKMWKSPLAKYLGIIGVGIPLIFVMYYSLAESWMLAYAFNSLTGAYKQGVHDFEVYLREFQGDLPTTNYFPGPDLLLISFFVMFLLNIIVLARGVAKGIELLAKIAMPLLFVFSVILFVRVLTLGWDKIEPGFAYLWNPDFSALTNPDVWLTACGQIFFSLSIGMGALVTYASYLRETDDVVLTGLSTAASNEFVEIVFGGSIAIPATAAFIGHEAIKPIAEAGTFNIGLVTFPQILLNIGFLEFFGTIWYLLLFFAAFTSSVALAEPSISFLQYELRVARVKAVLIIGAMWLIGTLPVIAFFKYGYLDEFDFWSGTFFIVLLAILEVIIFAWIFGIKKGWDEMHKGCDIRVPRIFLYITKYITPLILLAFFIPWLVTELPKKADIPPKINLACNNLKDLQSRVVYVPKYKEITSAVKILKKSEEEIKKQVEELNKLLRHAQRRIQLDQNWKDLTEHLQSTQELIKENKFGDARQILTEKILKQFEEKEKGLAQWIEKNHKDVRVQAVSTSNEDWLYEVKDIKSAGTPLPEKEIKEYLSCVDIEVERHKELREAYWILKTERAQNEISHLEKLLTEAEKKLKPEVAQYTRDALEKIKQGDIKSATELLEKSRNEIKQDITTVIDGLHCAPYIWGARVQIAFFFILFCVLCYIAWRGRK